MQGAPVQGGNGNLCKGNLCTGNLCKGHLRKGYRNALTMRKGKLRGGNLRKGKLCKDQNALVHLHRGPIISQRALEAILQTVGEHGPEHPVSHPDSDETKKEEQPSHEPPAKAACRGQNMWFAPPPESSGNDHHGAVVCQGCFQVWMCDGLFHEERHMFSIP